MIILVYEAAGSRLPMILVAHADLDMGRFWMMANDTKPINNRRMNNNNFIHVYVQYTF